MHYSQFGEDRILGRLFPSTAGTCVEVGANDGIHLSNTYRFEQLGWRCVLVEPTPHLCDAIRKNRRAMLFQCAASDAEAEAVLHVAVGAGADVYSSLEPTHANVRDVTVPTRRLDSILTEAGIGPIDFISIDVEGHELSVLRGFSLDRWNPRVAIIEDDSDLADTPVTHFMRDHGYIRFYRTGGNDWYARNPERLLLNGPWGLKGLAKAFLPPALRRAALTLRRAL